MKLCIVLLVLLQLVPAKAEDPVTVMLWPDGPPSPMPGASEATVKLIESYGGVTDTRLSYIKKPMMEIYRPANPNGASVIVAPGGGFMFLSYSFEGTQVCKWLNSLGITAALLKYRTPTRDDAEPFKLPVEDAQRAIGFIRNRAKTMRLDPKRVGLLGFSAGANVAGHVAWDHSRTYQPVPGYDDPRPPDFIVFIYGGGFLDKDDKSKFRTGFSVPADAPPCFFLVAHDDKNNPIETTMLYLEYKKLNLPAEVHICTKGGHGFGMRKAGHPINDWPDRCAEWMKTMGFLNTPSR